jgi:hypothetical protein
LFVIGPYYSDSEVHKRTESMVIMFSVFVHDQATVTGLQDMFHVCEEKEPTVQLSPTRICMISMEMSKPTRLLSQGY